MSGANEQSGFLDFPQAFETVPHSSLLDKLSSCGESRCTVCWDNIWLKGRAHRVVVNGFVCLAPIHQQRSSAFSSRSVLLHVCINGLDAGVGCIVSRLADTTKLGDAVDWFEGQDVLQRDLDRLVRSAVINRMRFIKYNCWILHLGWRSTDHKYKL